MAKVNVAMILNRCIIDLVDSYTSEQSLIDTTRCYINLIEKLCAFYVSGLITLEEYQEHYADVSSFYDNVISELGCP